MPVGKCEIADLTLASRIRTEIRSRAPARLLGLTAGCRCAANSSADSLLLHQRVFWHSRDYGSPGKGSAIRVLRGSVQGGRAAGSEADSQLLRWATRAAAPTFGLTKAYLLAQLGSNPETGCHSDARNRPLRAAAFRSESSTSLPAPRTDHWGHQARR